MVRDQLGLRLDMSDLLTVTSNDNELVIVRDVVDGNLWERGDDLLLGWEVGALLEFKVSDGAGQCEVAIDTTKVDETSGGTNSCLLAWRCVRRMGKAQRVRCAYPRFAACGRKTMALHGP